MYIAIYSILTICLLFLIGYLLYRVIRKKADKSFDESQSDMQYIENLKSDTVSLLGELSEVLMPKFETQAQILQAKQKQLTNVPFNTIVKNRNTKEAFESMKISLQEFKDFTSDIGIEYITDDNIQSLLEKVKTKP